MFIIWRGWAGAVTILIIVCCLGVAGAVAGALETNAGQLGPLALGIGASAAAAGTWFLGTWANRTQPQRRLDEFLANRHRELHTLADQGQFSLGPGHAAPRSLQEAHAQADQLLAVEKQDLTGRLFNRHHLWFIPVQFWGYICGVIGVLLIVWGIIRVATT